MKNTILVFASLLFSLFASAQRIHKVILTDKGATTTTCFLLNENVVIYLSDEGDIKEWGVDLYADRPADYVNRKITPYGGRVEYYNEKDNEAFRGKLKYVGNVLITYYASFDEKSMAGKIKSIGTSTMNYYTVYDDPSSKGKLKSIGRMNFTYYSSFDNDAFKGKIKNAGTVGFTYYASTDDKAFAGKVKSMNNMPFTYYSSQDRAGLKGAQKSGNQLQVINGITYWIKN
jgi:hypothetical protein